MGANSSTPNAHKQRPKHDKHHHHHDQVRGRRQHVIPASKSHQLPQIIHYTPPQPDVVQTTTSASTNDMTNTTTIPNVPTADTTASCMPYATRSMTEQDSSTNRASPDTSADKKPSPSVQRWRGKKSVTEPLPSPPPSPPQSQKQVNDDENTTTNDRESADFRWTPVCKEEKSTSTTNLEERESEEKNIKDVSGSSPLRPPKHQQKQQHYDMNTIRQAGVSVRNRISLFGREGANTPLVVASPGEERGARRATHSHDRENGGSSLTAAGDDDRPRSKSLFEENDSSEHRTHTPTQQQWQQPKRRHSNRVLVLPDLDGRLPAVSRSPDLDASRQTTTVVEPTAPEPEIDYNLNSPKAGEDSANQKEGREDGDKGGQVGDDNRMNTLEYFKRVPRETALLKGFEKAKPAAMHKRAKPHRRAGAAADRPVSMFPTTEASLYSCNQDVRRAGNSQLSWPYQHENEVVESAVAQGDDSTNNGWEELGTMNKRGQKYAMDDTSYETLSRKKKIAGQQLAVGMVDKETERNFLMSLKRNLQLKQAAAERRRSSAAACRDLAATTADDVTDGNNRVNLTEIVF